MLYLFVHVATFVKFDVQNNIKILKFRMKANFAENLQTNCRPLNQSICSIDGSSTARHVSVTKCLQDECAVQNAKNADYENLLFSKKIEFDNLYSP